MKKTAGGGRGPKTRKAREDQGQDKKLSTGVTFPSASEEENHFRSQPPTAAEQTFHKGDVIMEETNTTVAKEQSEASAQAAESIPAKPSREEVDALIRNRVRAAMVVGLVPIPAFDMAALASLQVEMIYKLGKLYNVPFKAEWGRQITAALVGEILPGLISPKLSYAVARNIPLIGFGLGVVTMPLANAASTYAVGQVFARRFADGEFTNMDLKKVGEEIKDCYAESKKTVSGWFKKDKKEEAVASAAGESPTA